MQSFESTIEIQWRDVDQNQHVRHSAYYDYGAHARIRYFMSLGYGPKQFAKEQFGPIIFHEQCSFIKELHLEDTITINFLKGEVNHDGSRWTIHHEILNSKGEKAAHVTLKGAWMDLVKRKLTVPPKAIADGFHNLPQGHAV